MNAKLILAALSVFACTTAAAQPADESLPVVMGAGASSCGKLLGDVRANGEAGAQTYLTWAQGYMSSVNMMKSKQVKSLKFDPEALRAHLIRYCQDKPPDDVVDAVNMLMLELYGKR